MSFFSLSFKIKDFNFILFDKVKLKDSISLSLNSLSAITSIPLSKKIFFDLNLLLININT